MGLLETLSTVLKNALAQPQTAPGQGAPEAEATPDLLWGTSAGGLQDLVERLKAGGLGEEVRSWLGSGANLPVSADQIRGALGDEHVRQIAARFGISTDSAAEFLSGYLPDAVDKASPGGTIEPQAQERN
jgi:uncharacterized protein YidB (DUF937 family)